MKTAGQKRKPDGRRTEKLSPYYRLSHLSYRQACGLLREEVAALLPRSYEFQELDVKHDIYLGEDIFRLSIHEP